MTSPLLYGTTTRVRGERPLEEFCGYCGSELRLDMELHAQPDDITHKAVEVLDRPRPHTKG